MFSSKLSRCVSLHLQNKDNDQLHKLGGVDGLAQLLVSSLEDGLQAGKYDSMSLDQRRDMFGANRFKELPPKAFWALVFENLQDSTLILLMAAAAVSLSDCIILHLLLRRY